MSSLIVFPRRTSVLAGLVQVLDQCHHILIDTPLVGVLIHHFPHQVNSKTADFSLLNGQADIGLLS